MVSELVIHLGDHGTGTTALQKAFATSSVRINTEVPFYYGSTLHRLTAGLMQSDLDPALFKQQFEGVAERFDKSTATIGILSDAGFEKIAPRALEAVIREFLPDYREGLRLVAYVQPHLDRFVDAFADHVRMSPEADLMEPFLDNIIKQGTLDYAPRFAQWKDMFGDSFTLRPYVRDQLAEGDIVTDFAGWLSRGKDWTVEKQTTRNGSLMLSDLSILQMLGRRANAVTPALSKEVRRAIDWNLAEIMTSLPDPSAIQLGLDHRLAKRIAVRFADDAAALDTVFFPGGVMKFANQSALDRTLDAAQSLEAKDNLSPASLRLAQSGGDLLLRVATADQKWFALAILNPEIQHDIPKSPAAYAKNRRDNRLDATIPVPGSASQAILVNFARLGQRLAGSLGRLTRPVRRVLLGFRR